MESRGRPFNLALPVPRRPLVHHRSHNHHRRSPSNSSVASRVSDRSDASSEDQFVLSPPRTPGNEGLPFKGQPPPPVGARGMVRREEGRNGNMGGKGLIEEDHARPRDRRDAEDIPRAAASNFLSVTPSSKSKPIAIPLPPDRRQDPLCASASTPPAPLSARGDLPGGYFPLHEDPDSRLHIPHPFHVDASMARQQSLRRAAESSKSPTMPAMPIPIPTVRTQPPPPSLPSIPTTAPPPGRMTATAQQGMTAHSSPASSPSTPISSYIPSGLLHASAALPMGKYYPSNWEKRHGKAPLLASHQSEGNGIAKHHQNGHKGAGVGGGGVAGASGVGIAQDQGKRAGAGAGAEGGGDATRRRLLQYQRDMVAQAAMSANAVIAAASSSSSPSPFASPSSPFSPGSGASTSTGGLASGGEGNKRGGGRKKSNSLLLIPPAVSAMSLLRAHRPASPRLRPLGSPGPVTPMSLEGEGGVWEGVAASGSGDGLVRGGDVEKYEEGEDSDGETRARVKRRGHGQARELVGVASI